MREDKKAILKRLKLLLMITRTGCEVDDLQLSEDETTVTVKFCNGHTRDVCVEADSGIAMIMDVVKALV